MKVSLKGKTDSLCQWQRILPDIKSLGSDNLTDIYDFARNIIHIKSTSMKGKFACFFFEVSECQVENYGVI